MIAEDFQRRFDIQVTYDHTGTADFSAHIEHHVLRIVQESLMNAVRHGKASRITISSVTTHSGAILTIADNGIGFDSHRKSTGFGITSMRERAQDIPNGTLKIRSITGNGTQVILAWEQEA